ncbi:glycosyltransferase family 61 protein [Paracoccus sp. MBLB3053]|uniref:Glycosyltransferase family 61 protein n=1 Tax=Paracoccus aurantius TaxID=3073814 RepID=A0ABU2HUK9_9RHOB|nr:glycosyltransferase family 61 protein [Paracoccus sp. MBLB3053]MDS9468294.1 glycosyltransferase family 61 protein [Paracoccus sp. MBLB3053]
MSLRPLTYRVRNLLGRGNGDLAAAADDIWTIAPEETREVHPVIILPGQADRITRAEFSTLPWLIKSLAGDPEEKVGPTLGYRLSDVDIVDGVLYSRGMTLHLRQRKRRLGVSRIDDLGSGVLYETWIGNRWFGNWLTDDCLTYRLAEALGTVMTTMPERGGHVPRYEELLAMKPQRITDAHLDEAILFDDHPNNSNRIARAQDMRRRLMGNPPMGGDDLVFLVRGRTGDQRIMENEMQIAEQLEKSHGFRVMSPEQHSVDELMSACGAARVVAGIEGSQLNHGVVAMPPGGTLLTIQPPDRATTAMKLLTDRWQQRFAMVVGYGTAESFMVEPQDVLRTFDKVMQLKKSDPYEQAG